MRVAIDLSFAATVALTADVSISGISRAACETARTLAARGVVDLTCVGWSGPEPVLAAASVRRWARHAGLPTDPISTSRLGLGRTYEQIAVGLTRGSVARGLSRVGLAALKRGDVVPGVDRQPFDVFHSTFWPLPRRSHRAARARVITVYDLIPFTDPPATTDAQRELLRAILESIDRDRDVVIAISEHTKAELCEIAGIDPDRVVVAALAAADHFRPAELDRSAIWLPEALRNGAPFLLSVAASQPRKNVSHLVRAFARLVEEIPELTLQLVLAGGDGWLGDDVQSVLDAAPALSGRVHRVGLVPDAALVQLYAGAMAFVFPSRSEGFGLPALEAMQSGTPTVVTRSGALPEVVGGGALVVEPGDVDQLTRALRDLVSSEPLRRRVAAAGLARASLFSWDRCGAATEQAYSLASRLAG